MDNSQTPIIIGSDHAAFPMKETVKNFLSDTGIEVTDAGTSGLESVNYSDFGIKVAGAVSSGEFERGILICGTGLGMSMVANRFKHIRAALCGDIFSARMSRLHNNANILDQIALIYLKMAGYWAQTL